MNSGTQVGEWELLSYHSQVLPVHSVLLHTGKVLFISGSGNDPKNFRANKLETRLWDPKTGEIKEVRTDRDLFCCGHSFLPDGRLVAAGGNRGYNRLLPACLFTGLRDTHVFDPEKEEWTRVEDMADGRWYPTCVTLPNGDVLVASGVRSSLWKWFIPPFGFYDKQVEIYNPDSGWRYLEGADHLHPLYPRFHLLPSGEVFCSGPDKETHILDLSSSEGGTWRMGPPSGFGTREDGTSVLLPLSPPEYPARILILGGSKRDAVCGKDWFIRPTDTAELLDLGTDDPRWESLPRLKHPRRHVNAVLLPDGTVLVVGGSSRGDKSPVLECEVFDPDTKTWSSAPSMDIGRLYHSVALLLPDGRVWTGGGNPRQGDDELRMEIFSPPYLFTSERPEVTEIDNEVRYGAEMKVATPDAPAVDRVVLVRPSAVTHSFSMTQRLVVLEITDRDDSSLTVKMPPNGNLAPPGYYLLFAVTDEGVPSEGRFLQLS